MVVRLINLLVTNPYLRWLWIKVGTWNGGAVSVGYFLVSFLQRFNR